MTLTNRLLISLPMGLVFIAIGMVVFFIGFMGGMTGTGSCGSANLDLWSAWLFVVWPLILLASAIAPSIMVVLSKPWYWVLGSIVLGIVASIAGFGVWLMLINKLCG